jgi:CheY-like chemotaxis protein
MDEEIALRQYADSIILKDVRSQERLIDEVALFLHRVVNELPEDKKRVIRHLHESDEQLKSRKILIVEDDMRTMFAMTKVLASHGLNPIKAENGEKALEMVKNHPDIDLILMDMMMPVMDGYETMQHIREMKQFVNLPIIALTAKAMKEDRKKCLEAGATDYLSKPVDPERLLSLIRVWLCR